jgi:hypothetical protein
MESPLCSVRRTLDKQRKYWVSLYLVLTKRPAESQNNTRDNRYSHAVIEIIGFFQFPQIGTKLMRRYIPQRYNRNTT